MSREIVMWLLPRLRLALARRPWLYWCVVGVCALLVWLQWSGAQAAAEQARTSWGQSRQVLVAVTAGAPGEVLVVERRDYPAAMVPAAAISAIDPAAVAARHVDEGVVLVPADVAGEQTTPADWVVLAVPAQGAPAFAPGASAAVYGGGARHCDGLVAAATEDRVEVAVPPDCAAPLTDLLLAGSVVLARLP